MWAARVYDIGKYPSCAMCILRTMQCRRRLSLSVRRIHWQNNTFYCQLSQSYNIYCINNLFYVFAASTIIQFFFSPPGVSPAVCTVRSQHAFWSMILFTPGIIIEKLWDKYRLLPNENSIASIPIVIRNLFFLYRGTSVFVLRW